MSSSQKQGSKILGLITPREAEAFLMDAANLPSNYWRSEEEQVPGSPYKPSRAIKMLSSRYPRIFEAFRDKPHLLLLAMDPLRHFLRRAWDTSDARHRDWYLFEMRQKWRDLLIQAEGGPKNEVTQYSTDDEISVLKIPVLTVTRMDPRLEEPPPLMPIEAAVFYLQTRIGDRAKHCGNTDCPAPYFIAVKRWQKYCSEACAGPATRESKRKWWHEHKGGGSL